jgi:hypothetical protein
VTVNVIDGSTLLLKQNVQPEKSFPLKRSMRSVGVMGAGKSAAEACSTTPIASRKPKMMTTAQGDLVMVEILSRRAEDVKNTSMVLEKCVND